MVQVVVIIENLYTRRLNVPSDNTHHLLMVNNWYAASDKL